VICDVHLEVSGMCYYVAGTRCQHVSWCTSTCHGVPLQVRGEGTYTYPDAYYGWGWGIRSKMWETLNAALRRSVGPACTKLPPETSLWYSRGREEGMSSLSCDTCHLA
jgi:hypothetical protein